MNTLNLITSFLKESEKLTVRSNSDLSIIRIRFSKMWLSLIFLPLLLSINVIINAQTVDFAMIGDFGDGSSSETAVATEINTWGVDFVVTAGDNRYGSISFDAAVGKDYCAFLKDVVSGTNCSGGSATTNAFFPSTGNHDYTDGLGGGINEYLSYFTLPGTGITTSGTSGSELYYDFEQGIVHFFMIDSYTDLAAQQTWLQTQLAASTATWKVVIFHHAPYSSSSNHGSQTQMQWPFATWGADVVMSGHDHTYERIHQNGIVYFVNGLGGRSIYNFGTPVAGSQVRYNADYGAMKISADATSMNFQFINTSGTIIDNYTLGAASSGTLDLVIGASEDDSEERLSDGNISLTSTDIELGDDPGFYEDQLVGLLFRNINIQPGSTITSAYLTFTADETDAVATSITISAEDEDNAADFTTATNDLSGRTLTTASVDWNSIPAWNTVGETHQSPDISSLIQEVIDRGGWSANNKIAFIISGTGERTSEAYDGDVPSSAAALHVEYTGGSAGITMDIPITDGDDDVEENSTDGSMYFTSSDLELVDDPVENSDDQTVGMLFRNINVPQGETISSAYITFTAKDATSTATSVEIRAEDEDDATDFSTTAYNLSSRTVTSNFVDWNSIPA